MATYFMLSLSPVKINGVSTQENRYYVNDTDGRIKDSVISKIGKWVIQNKSGTPLKLKINGTSKTRLWEFSNSISDSYNCEEAFQPSNSYDEFLKTYEDWWYNSSFFYMNPNDWTRTFVKNGTLGTDEKVDIGADYFFTVAKSFEVADRYPNYEIYFNGKNVSKGDIFAGFRFYMRNYSSYSNLINLALYETTSELGSLSFKIPGKDSFSATVNLKVSNGFIEAK